MVCITKTDCRSNDAGWIKVKFKIKFCNEINLMNAKILLKCKIFLTYLCKFIEMKFDPKK